MAWTAPITFTAGTTLTATILNTYLRDNLLETAPAKATTPGGYFVTTGNNAIAERLPDAATVTTAETTVGTAYAALATAGPAVTVTTGVYALIMIYCRTENNTLDGQNFMSWAISGATTRAANDQTSITYDGMTAVQSWRLCAVDLLSDLTAGTNTFTCQYRVSNGTGTFADRRITVLPF